MSDLVLLNWKDKIPELSALKTNLTEEEISVLSLRRHSERSLISRGLLKKLLTERTGAKDIQLKSTENGKLFLENNAYQFSLAHSGDWMAFAFHPSGAIGVDIETWDRAEQILRFAPRHFKPREKSFLEKDPTLTKERALQIWTCKEAWLKAEGSTVFEALEHREIPISIGYKIENDGVMTFEHQVKKDSYFLTVATTNA